MNVMDFSVRSTSPRVESKMNLDGSFDTNEAGRRKCYRRYHVHIDQRAGMKTGSTW